MQTKKARAALGALDALDAERDAATALAAPARTAAPVLAPHGAGGVTAAAAMALGAVA